MSGAKVCLLYVFKVLTIEEHLRLLLLSGKDQELNNVTKFEH